MCGGVKRSRERVHRLQGANDYGRRFDLGTSGRRNKTVALSRDRFRSTQRAECSSHAAACASGVAASLTTGVVDGARNVLSPTNCLLTTALSIATASRPFNSSSWMPFVDPTRRTLALARSVMTPSSAEAAAPSCAPVSAGNPAREHIGLRGGRRRHGPRGPDELFGLQVHA